MSRPPKAARAFSLRRRMKSEQKIQFSRRKTIVFSVIICAVLIAILETSSYFLISRYAETGTFENREIQNPFHPFIGWSHPPNAHLKTYRDYSTGEYKLSFLSTFLDGNCRDTKRLWSPQRVTFLHMCAWKEWAIQPNFPIRVLPAESRCIRARGQLLATSPFEVIPHR